jgi:hypothetical protein
MQSPQENVAAVPVPTMISRPGGQKRKGERQREMREREMMQPGRRNDGAQEMVQPEAKQASQEHPGAPETLPATGGLSVPGGEKKMMEREIKRTQEATKFVAMLVEMKTFAVSSLRRRMSVLWEEERERTGGKIRVPTRSSLDIDEMYDPEFCKAGKDELPPHAYPFNIPAMDGFHVETCDECGAASEVSGSCYYSTLRRTITHGFNPPYASVIEAAYKTAGNNKLSAIFQKSFDTAVGKMVADGVLRVFTAC